MRTVRKASCAIALIPLVVACAVTAGCSSGGSRAADDSRALSCGMVVDPDATGYFGGPLTARRAVATLSALQRTEGTVPFATGALSRIDRGTLDIMAVELIGYSGSELADDAQAFARAELGYSSQGLPVDTSYAGQLTTDIAALERDCPPIHGHNHAHGN